VAGDPNRVATGGAEHSQDITGVRSAVSGRHRSLEVTEEDVVDVVAASEIDEEAAGTRTDEPDVIRTGRAEVEVLDIALARRNRERHGGARARRIGDDVEGVILERIGAGESECRRVVERAVGVQRGAELSVRG